MEAKRHYLAICEGSSEFAYVQELNRFLNENGLDLVFSAVDAGGGGFDNIRSLCRKRRIRPESRAFVLADRDLYFDETTLNGRRYAQGKDKLPKFFFQYFNFEDFLLMHYPHEIVEAWKAAVALKGHFVVPLKSVEYENVFADFVRSHESELQFGGDYRKGDLPFALSEEKMRNLLANNSNQSLPRSDFAAFLQQEIGNELD